MHANQNSEKYEGALGKKDVYLLHILFALL